MMKVSFIQIRRRVPSIRVNLVSLHGLIQSIKTVRRISQMRRSRAKSHLKASTVHPPDTLKPNVFSDTAPSRPPSRVSTRGNDIGENIGQESPYEKPD